jgi:hypothetical protein
MDLIAVTKELQKRCLTVKAGLLSGLIDINVGWALDPRTALQPILLAPPQRLGAH